MSEGERERERERQMTERQREGKGYWRMKKMYVCYIYTYEDSKLKHTKHCWKRGEKREGKWEYNGGGEHV
jgi:hypothetical protein